MQNISEGQLGVTELPGQPQGHVFNCTAYRRALGSKVQVDITRESRISKLKEVAVFASELEQYKDKMGIGI